MTRNKKANGTTAVDPVAGERERGESAAVEPVSDAPKPAESAIVDMVSDGSTPGESAVADPVADVPKPVMPAMVDPVADESEPAVSAVAKSSVAAPDTSAASGSGRMADLIQFVKFGLVGVLNTLVDFLVFTLLIWAGVHYLLAQPLSYGAGMVNSYLVNKFWTFQDRRSGIDSFIRFALLNGCTLLLSMGLLYVFADGLGLHPLLSKGVVTLFTVVANYAGSRWWVFRQA